MAAVALKQSHHLFNGDAALGGLLFLTSTMTPCLPHPILTRTLSHGNIRSALKPHLLRA